MRYSHCICGACMVDENGVAIMALVYGHRDHLVWVAHEWPLRP